MDCSAPGSPVLHYFLELVQIHVHWCHPTISSSIVPFSSCLLSFPASGSFQRVISSHQVVKLLVSASASVLPMNTQGWFPLQVTGFISLLFKGLSGVLQHHSSKASILWHSAFLMVRLSHPYMTPGKTIALTIWTFVIQIKQSYFSLYLQHMDGEWPDRFWWLHGW